MGRVDETTGAAGLARVECACSCISACFSAVCCVGYRSKKKAFDRYARRVADESNKDVAIELDRLKKHAHVIRVLAHTQIKLLKLRQKKAHLIEIQGQFSCDRTSQSMRNLCVAASASRNRVWR